MTQPFDVDALRERVRGGEAFSYRLFYGHTPREGGKLSNAVFSQFYTCRFEIDGQAYAWSEQWMMAEKARLFGDRNGLGRILKASSPHECKQFGREIPGYDDEAWTAARFDAVTRGNVAKFGQDPRLRQYLLDTGDDILVEAAPQDSIWGIGLHRDHPDAKDPLRWQGLNLLGFALVRARSILKGEAEC